MNEYGNKAREVRGLARHAPICTSLALFHARGSDVPHSLLWVIATIFESHTTTTTKERERKQGSHSGPSSESRENFFLLVSVFSSIQRMEFQRNNNNKDNNPLPGQAKRMPIRARWQQIAASSHPQQEPPMDGNGSPALSPKQPISSQRRQRQPMHGPPWTYFTFLAVTSCFVILVLVAGEMSASASRLISTTDTTSPWRMGQGSFTTIVVTQNQQRLEQQHGASQPQQQPVTSRPFIPHNEFFAPNTLSDEQVQEYFRFEWPAKTTLEQYFRRSVLSPLHWECLASSNQTTHTNRTRHMHKPTTSGKLVFLQMIRSGSIFLRTLLKAYGHVCRIDMATVNSCWDLGWSSLLPTSFPETAIWYNTAPDSPRIFQECELTSLVRYPRTRIPGRNETLPPLPSQSFNWSNWTEPHPVTSADIQAVDWLAGIVPLGSAAVWERTHNNKAVDARYVILLRDPLSRLVSQFLLRWTDPNITMTVEELVSRMTDSVQQRRRRASAPVKNATNRTTNPYTELIQKRLYYHYERLSNILITPEQRYWVEQNNVAWTLERQVNLSKSNLVQHKVIVGILERSNQSWALLQQVLDGESWTDSSSFSSPNEMFSWSSLVENVHKFPDKTRSMKKSQQEGRTQAMVKRIKANVTVHNLLQDYLQYEYDIYNFALHLHEIQYSIVQGNHRIHNQP